jgi:acylphosphatase
MVRARLLISGAVQGVGYRYSCRREAGARSLSGWVRNLPDGRVEALLQGPEPEVQAMIAWCRHGPADAEVAGVDVSYEEAKDDLAGFRIR